MPAETVTSRQQKQRTFDDNVLDSADRCEPLQVANLRSNAQAISFRGLLQYCATMWCDDPVGLLTCAQKLAVKPA